MIKKIYRDYLIPLLFFGVLVFFLLNALIYLFVFSKVLFAFAAISILTLIGLFALG